MKKPEISLDAGDVVLLDFPGVQQIKRRPAVILSSPVYHRERPDVIVGLITSQINAATASTDHALQRLGARSIKTTLCISIIFRHVTAFGNQPQDWQAFKSRLALNS